ncbi:MAG TPA: glycosyltransferase family 4 protein [Gemmatimonadales bacterium]|nr:glycosyltransferase family 4 protein [Gemmatimonadales bacterium]
MNILLVNWNDPENPHAGGAEVHLFEIFSRLVRRGHRVRLVCSGWPGAAPRATIDGIEVLRTGGRHTFALRGRGAVRRALAAEPVDVLVEDINKVPLYTAGLTRAAHCALVPHLFGATAFHEADPASAAIVWLSERPIPWAYRRSGWHAISESTRDDLVARGVPRERIEVIHPGVDAVRFCPDPAVRRTPAPSFLFLGRLKRYKGVETAIRALALARARRSDLRLDVVGSGDDGARLESLAAGSGLGDAVRFHGRVTEAEKLRFLRSAWANVFPSPKEGWGITNVEAAACGTPSLASDAPGLRDSVRHGETGFLVPHGDAPALAERYLALADDPALVERLGRQARAFAETLTWESAAQRTEAHLSSLIAAARRG